jgi:hypothetical protein
LRVWLFRFLSSGMWRRAAGLRSAIVSEVCN